MKKNIFNIMISFSIIFLFIYFFKLNNDFNEFRETYNSNSNAEKTDKKDQSSFFKPRDLDSIKKRLFLLEKALIVKSNRVGDDDIADNNSENTEIDLRKLDGVEKAEAILDIGKKNGEFTMKNIRMINSVMRNLSESERDQVKDEMMELIQSGIIEMPRPHPSTLNENDRAIDMKELPDNAVMVSP